MQVDYGYGDAQPDYGYGDAQPDYGYGDAQPVSTKEETIYAVDDRISRWLHTYRNLIQDYGYGEQTQPEAVKQAEERRPRRRCSVTKYSLEEAGKKDGSPEAEMAQQLQAVDMINQFRSAGRSSN